MVFKPNYNHQRAERDRAKQAKKEAKAREREDAAAQRRKAEQEEGEPAAPEPSALDRTRPPGGEFPIAARASGALSSAAGQPNPGDVTCTSRIWGGPACSMNAYSGFVTVFEDERMCAMEVPGEQMLLLFRHGMTDQPAPGRTG